MVNSLSGALIIHKNSAGHHFPVYFSSLTKLTYQKADRYQLTNIRNDILKQKTFPEIILKLTSHSPTKTLLVLPPVNKIPLDMDSALSNNTR